jgi:hypothetical protein
MADILQAARSYYGLSDANVRKTEWFTDEGKTILCFEIVAEGEDFIGIVERMKRLQEDLPEPVASEDTGPYAGDVSICGLSGNDMAVWIPTTELFDYQKQHAITGQIDGALTLMPWLHMTKQQRIVYPLPAQNDEGVGGRKVAHIDAPEAEEPMTMDAVWLTASQTTEQQRRLSADYDVKTDRWLVQWPMLTEEQRQKAKEKL